MEEVTLRPQDSAKCPKTLYENNTDESILLNAQYVRADKLEKWSVPPTVKYCQRLQN